MSSTNAFKMDPSVQLNVKRLVLQLVLSAPGLLILGFVLAYAVNVPVRDDWTFPGRLYSDWVAGELSIADLLATTNEHQKLFPNLVALAVGAISGWYVPTYMFFSWVCVMVSFVLILSIFRNTNSGPFARGSWLALLWAVLLFSPVQYANQFWSIQWVTFVPLLCLVLSLWLQTLHIPYGSKCVVAALLNTIAMFSFASGTLNWLFAFPTLSIHNQVVRELPAQSRWVTRPRLIYWSVGLLMFSVYFWNYEHASRAGALGASLQQPLLLVQYFLAWLGAPLCLWLGRNVTAATAIGGLIMSVLLGSLFAVLRQWHRQDSGSALRLYPWLCITAYAAAVGMMIAVGRLGFGLYGSTAPRYASYPLWFCVGLAGLVYCLASRTTRPLSRPRKMLSLVSYVLLFAWLSAGWVFGHEKILRQHEERKQMLLTLRLLPSLPENPLARQLMPNTTGLQRRSGRVMQAGLLDVQPIGPWLLASLSTPESGVAGVFTLRRVGEQHLVINGWAGLPTSRIPADFVILARAEDEGKVTAITAFTVTRERADVAKRQGTHKLLMSGFRRRLELVSDADDELIMLAVDESARQVFRLRRVPRR